MRITLNQDEIFEALGNYLSQKLFLEEDAQLSISLTAGRTPRGYTADVEVLSTHTTSSRYVAAEEAPVPPQDTPVSETTEALDQAADQAADRDQDGSAEAQPVQATSLFG